MTFRWNGREQLAFALYFLKWLAITAPVATIIGSVCALFLWSLERVTQFRFTHLWVLFLLPFAGAAISILYTRFGGASEGGNNLLMDAIHDLPSGDEETSASQNPDSSVVVPRRMAPLILLATVVTHLFGGSAGREGTAVQMGGALAAAFGRAFGLNQTDLRTLLMAGIAAGFGGVFGTPLAGAVFAMEVIVVGRMTYDALIPCLIAALFSDWACGAWGVHHLNYKISAAALHLGGTPVNWWLALKIALASVAFGLASVLFAEMTHGIHHAFRRYVKRPFLRPIIGGLCIIALVYLCGTRDYLGLGESAPRDGAVTIFSCFAPQGADDWSWFLKLLFTAVTLGSGFKGGEVTPLFFIGAALGNVLGRLFHAPVDLFAGLGLVAVFAGATNTPLACTIMGIELFGAQYTIYFAIACFLAYLCSGHSGIYLSQRIGTPKLKSAELPSGASLRTARTLRPQNTASPVRWRRRSTPSHRDNDSINETE